MGCTSSNPDPACFVAILEGRGSAKGEVGMAAICLTNPMLVLCQFSVSTTYPRTLTKLLSINPAQIIIPDSGTSGVKLYNDISSHLQMATVVPVHMRHFNESKGMQAITQLLVPEFASVELQFHNTYYCLAAPNALIKCRVHRELHVCEEELEGGVPGGGAVHNHRLCHG
jgi:DNA mismatch repair protein MSH4